MNNQIPHCVFAAKFNSVEQRIELFKCNSRAQKEFNINDNEDFDKFISHTYLLQSQNPDKTEKTLMSGTSTKQQQTWQNSLKGKIRQLIESKIQEQKILTLAKMEGDTNNIKQNGMNNSSPIIKLKLRQQDGIGTENKINVRLSIFKLYEYYVIITVDRNRKRSSKTKKYIKQKSGLESSHGGKMPKQFTLENICIQTNNELIMHQSEAPSPLKITSTAQMNNLQTDTLNLHHNQHPTISQTNIYNNHNNLSALPLFKSTPAQFMLPQKILNDEDQSFIQNKQSPPPQPNNSFQLPHQPFQNTRITNNSVPTNIFFQTPPSIAQEPNSKNANNNNNNSNSNNSNNSNINNNRNNSHNNNQEFNINGQTDYQNEVNNQQGNHGNLQPRRSLLSTKQGQNSNYYLNYMAQKKLSLSAMGVRKPMNSVNSAASTCLPTSTTHINQPRTTSFGQEYFQSNHIVSSANRYANQFIQQSNNHLQLNQFGHLSQQQNIPSQNSTNPSIQEAKNIDHNKLYVKEQLLDSCFEIIAQTIQLIQRYKSTAQNFKISKISQYFLSPQITNDNQQTTINNENKNETNTNNDNYYEALEKYTSCIFQQILITNSNFMKFTKLVFNQVHLNHKIFNAQEIINFLNDQIQPILIEKSIKLYLQDDFNEELQSDLNTLKLILINILTYCGRMLNELEYIAVKLSLSEDKSNLKIQLSMPYHENHVFNQIQTLHQLSYQQIQKDYIVMNKFHIDLRVAFSMIKKLNNDNPSVNDYLKYSQSHPVNNHMYLTFTVPIQNNQQQQPPLSSNEIPLLSGARNYQNNINSPEDSARRLEEHVKQPNNIQDIGSQSNDVKQALYQNIQSREIKNTEECFLDDSINSLERWVTIKQYTSRITDKQIKLIL